MDLPRNRFKHAIAEGKLQIGLWSQLVSPLAVEVIAGAGFDFIVLDAEHAPNDVSTIVPQLQAVEGSDATAMVRAPWNDMVWIKRFLDAGAPTLLLPFVQTEEEARQAVAYTRYPPDGVRGVALAHRASRFGRVDGYFQKAASEICVVVQVETAEAIQRLEAIARVDGIDGVFIGPADLAASMDHLGNPGHADVQAAIASGLERAKEAGKPAGILTGVEADARRFIDMGFTFVAVGGDLGLLAAQTSALARAFKPGVV